MRIDLISYKQKVDDYYDIYVHEMDGEVLAMAMFAIGLDLNSSE